MGRETGAVVGERGRARMKSRGSRSMWSGGNREGEGKKP